MTTATATAPAPAPADRTLTEPITIRAVHGADTSRIEWQLLSPYSPDAVRRLAAYISETTAFAEQHRMRLALALLERPRNGLVNLLVAADPSTPACLTDTLA